MADDSLDAEVELDRVAEDVMDEVSLLLELETVLDAYDDGDDEGSLDMEPELELRGLELELGVTPAGMVSAGNVEPDAVVDTDIDIDDVIDVAEELILDVIASLVVDATELEEEPVPCRGTRTLKSAMPPTAACCILCFWSSSGRDPV